MPSTEAAVSVSSRRGAPRSVPADNGCTPRSPSVATIRTTRQPASTALTMVPPVKMASSSGWACNVTSTGLTARSPSCQFPWCSASNRLVAAQRDPLDDPALSAEVADHRVLGGSVVPESDVSGAPVVAGREFGTDRMAIEERQQSVTFGALEFDDVGGESGVHEQRPGPRLGVG